MASGTIKAVASKTDVNALSEQIGKLIKYEEINVNPDSAISAGVIGTRGAQKTVTYHCPSGYSVIGIVVTFIGNSSMVSPLVFLSNGALFVNWYRATSEAIGTANASITIRLTYAKISSV